MGYFKAKKFRSLAKIFYKDAKVIIFVYDVMKKRSFEAIIDYWYKDTKCYTDSDVILAVMGNKIDRYNDIQVSVEERKKFERSINTIFELTSEKSDSRINNLFDKIGHQYLDPSFAFLENKKSEEREKIFEEKKSRKTLRGVKLSPEKKEKKDFLAFLKRIIKAIMKI